MRVDEKWTRFVIVPRDALRAEHELHGVGSVHDGRLTLNLYLRSGGTVTAGTGRGDEQRDWTCFLEHWPLAA